MKLHTPLALFCVLALTGCNTEPSTPPQPPAAQPAETTTKAPDAPAESATADQPSEAQPGLPSAAELAVMFDKATRIEARSGSLEEQKWSRELTAAEIAVLKAGIGQATDLSPSVPRCLPTVLATLYQQEQELVTLGAFCDRGSITGRIRFEIGETMGSFVPADLAKIDAALKSPSGE